MLPKSGYMVYDALLIMVTAILNKESEALHSGARSRLSKIRDLLVECLLRRSQ